MARKKKEHILFDRMNRVKPKIDFRKLFNEHYKFKNFKKKK